MDLGSTDGVVNLSTNSLDRFCFPPAHMTLRPRGNVFPDHCLAPGSAPAISSARRPAVPNRTKRHDRRGNSDNRTEAKRGRSPSGARTPRTQGAATRSEEVQWLSATAVRPVQYRYEHHDPLMKP